MAEVEQKRGRVVTGRVISNKCNQTITVLIEHLGKARAAHGNRLEGKR